MTSEKLPGQTAEVCFAPPFGGFFFLHFVWVLYNNKSCSRICEYIEQVRTTVIVPEVLRTKATVCFLPLSIGSAMQPRLDRPLSEFSHPPTTSLQDFLLPLWSPRRGHAVP